MPILDRQGDVFILDLGENRFHPDWIASVNAATRRNARLTGVCAYLPTAAGPARRSSRRQRTARTSWRKRGEG